MLQIGIKYPNNADRDYIVICIKIVTLKSHLNGYLLNNHKYEVI